ILGQRLDDDRVIGLYPRRVTDVGAGAQRRHADVGPDADARVAAEGERAGRADQLEATPGDDVRVAVRTDLTRGACPRRVDEGFDGVVDHSHRRRAGDADITADRAADGENQ